MMSTQAVVLACLSLLVCQTLGRSPHHSRQRQLPLQPTQTDQHDQKERLRRHLDDFVVLNPADINITFLDDSGVSLTFPFPTEPNVAAAKLYRYRRHQPITLIRVGNGGSSRVSSFQPDRVYRGSLQDWENSMISALVDVEAGIVSAIIKPGDGTLYAIEPESPSCGRDGARAHPQGTASMQVACMHILYAQHHLRMGNESVQSSQLQDQGWHHRSRDVGDKPSFCAALKPPVTVSNQIPRSQTRIHRRAGGPASGLDTCTVTLVADYRYHNNMGGNFATTANALVNHLDFVNTNFRQTDFDGLSNIGVAVNKVIIYETSGADPYYQASNWDVQELLEEFSRSDWSDACLSYLFTHQEFSNGVQGLAWVGSTTNAGICDGFGVPSKSTYLNTGLVTSLNWGHEILQLMFKLTLQHEIGHNFGSPHDPDTTACQPSSGGNYVMYATAVDGSQANNDNFSPCSISSIRPIIDARSSCFTTTPEGVCGNGKLEPEGADGELGTGDDEECDAGFEGDSCCTSSCKLKSGAACSDANYECCEACQQAAGKLCYQEFDLDPQCRATAYCGNSSLTCPTPSQKPEGTPCGNNGRCRAAASPNNRCIPLCTFLGAQSCDCPGATEQECQLCCTADNSLSPFCPTGFVYEVRTHTNGTSAYLCFPQDTIGWDGNTDIVLPVRLFGTNCTKVIDVVAARDINLTDSDGNLVTAETLIKRPGTPCSLGLCDDSGQCQPNDDLTTRVLDFFASLSFEEIEEWLRGNVVLAILLAAFIVYAPIAFCCNRRDQAKLEKLRADARKVQQLRQKRRRHTFEWKDDDTYAIQNAGRRVAPMDSSSRAGTSGGGRQAWSSANGLQHSSSPVLNRSHLSQHSQAASLQQHSLGISHSVHSGAQAQLISPMQEQSSVGQQRNISPQGYQPSWEPTALAASQVDANETAKRVPTTYFEQMYPLSPLSTSPSSSLNAADQLSQTRHMHQLQQQQDMDAYSHPHAVIDLDSSAYQAGIHETSI